MSFFVAGGTVPPGSPSYVERAADRELYEALLAGEFCHVLNSRQMGKSSLAVRTITRLNEAGVRTAFVDLTRLGSTGADPDRWYAGLLGETGRALGLRGEAMAYLKANAVLPPVARLFGFLRDVALAGSEERVVLMVDEIDAVRSLPFPADDLFAGLRELWNARATDPALRRLTVCLLGAALPSDLIADPRRTPFNVGRRIELRDFTAEEARPFASQVGESALGRVLYWTGGHPFLTQTLCATLAESLSHSGEEVQEVSVDALIRSRYLDARARETDTNLADVGRRLLGEGDPDVTDEGRATTLALYERVLKGKPVPDDESNPAAARIKMSGVARVDGGLLKPRNRIYSQAFDRRWVKGNTPGQELRRQKRAFWKGALRTGAIATIVVAAIGGLAMKNARLATAERSARERADYEAYAASMSLMPSLWQEGGFERMDATLQTTERSPSRGWEWGYWRHQNDPGKAWTDEMAGTLRPEVSPNGRLLAARTGDTIKILDAHTLRLLDRIPVPGRSPIVSWVDDDHLLTITFANKEMSLVDRRSKRVVRGLGRFYSLFGRPASGRWVMAGWTEDNRPAWLDLRTGDVHPLPARVVPDALFACAFSPDARYCAFPVQFTSRKGAPWGVMVYETHRWSVVKQFDVAGSANMLEFSPDGSRLAIGTRKDVALWDWRTGRASSPRRDLGGTPIDLRFSSDGLYLVAVGLRRQGRLYSVAPQDLRPTGNALKGVLSATFLPGTHQMLAGYDRYRLIDADALGRSDVVVVGKAYDGRWRREKDGLRLLRSVRGTGADRIVDVDLSGLPAIRTHQAPSDQMDIGDAEGLVIDMKDAKRPRIQVQEGGSWSTLPGKDLSGRSWSFPARDRCLLNLRQGGLRVLDLRTGRLGRTIDVGGVVSDVDVCRDGTRVAVGLLDGRAGLYDVASGKPLWAGAYHAAWPVAQILFSPDEKTVLTAGQDQTATVIDARSGRLRLRLKGHLHTLGTIDESPDGHRIATGSDDRTVRIWDSSTGRELTSIPFTVAVSHVRFSRDGRRLFALLDDGTLHVLSSDGA